MRLANVTYPSQTTSGQPLVKRTSDNVICSVFFSPVPFRINGATLTKGPSWIEYDGVSYTAITVAQAIASYTVAGNTVNHTGR